MDKNTVDKIEKNAREGAKVYQTFLKDFKAPMLFRRYFHLRPTSGGTTIVCALPEGAMRGIDCTDVSQLQKKLEDIGNSLPALLADDRATRRNVLDKLGFAQRKNGDSKLEEDVQAKFINGMINGECAYRGIQFVASELNLEDANRFDVVGFKDDTLYIFELKRGRETSALSQVKGYCDHARVNKSEFERVLACYPNLAVPSFSKIQGIAVMALAENSLMKKWTELLNDTALDADDLQIWFFEDALSFRTVDKES